MEGNTNYLEDVIINRKWNNFFNVTDRNTKTLGEIIDFGIENYLYIKEYVDKFQILIKETIKKKILAFNVKVKIAYDFDKDILNVTIFEGIFSIYFYTFEIDCSNDIPRQIKSTCKHKYLNEKFFTCFKNSTSKSISLYNIISKELLSIIDFFKNSVTETQKSYLGSFSIGDDNVKLKYKSHCFICNYLLLIDVKFNFLGYDEPFNLKYMFDIYNNHFLGYKIDTAFYSNNPKYKKLDEFFKYYYEHFYDIPILIG